MIAFIYFKAHGQQTWPYSVGCLPIIKESSKFPVWPWVQIYCRCHKCSGWYRCVAMGHGSSCRGRLWSLLWRRLWREPRLSLLEILCWMGHGWVLWSANPTWRKYWALLTKLKNRYYYTITKVFLMLIFNQWRSRTFQCGIGFWMST